MTTAIENPVPLGEWKLQTRRERSPTSLLEIPVVAVALGGEDPTVHITSGIFEFRYKDGRRTVVPLATIFRADFTPAQPPVALPPPRDPAKHSA